MSDVIVNHQFLIQNSAVVTENGPILQISAHPRTLRKQPQSFDDILTSTYNTKQAAQNVC